MNPDAVRKFVELTHDAYARHLEEHMGKTVVAMFTDEPNPLGRSPRKGVKPFTTGFVEYLRRMMDRDDVETWLPALWLDYGPRTNRFRQAYDRAVHQRIVETFYAAQSAWCEKHAIALTGHPHASNDMTTLSSFHWPGQDMVWRWVVPGDASGLVGPDSVAPKAATSAARSVGKRRIATELFGAYGWQLSLDEAKWLTDWHLLRGNNLFLLHAFFYSVRGGRAYESEPDLGIHNTWWPAFQSLVRYIRRMCWLLTDCEHQCTVAVLGDGYNLPWESANRLYRGQIDFLYIDELSLENADVDQGTLRVGTQAYRAIIVDGDSHLSAMGRRVLSAFEESGGRVIPRRASGDWIDIDVIAPLVDQTFTVHTASQDLRTMHVRKEGLDLLVISNEGESSISVTLNLSSGKFDQVDAVAVIDPLRMTATQLMRSDFSDRGVNPFHVTLDRRETRLIIPRLQTQGAPPFIDVPPANTAESLVEASGPWSVVHADGEPFPLQSLGDWTQIRELECFNGSVSYATTVNLSRSMESVIIDLGVVGEIAEVRVNGAWVGFQMWAPYKLRTPGSVWRVGPNLLDVRVTNSAANAMEGAMRPSGLMGPVTLLLSSQST